MRKSGIKYAVTFGVGAALALMSCWARGLFEVSDKLRAYRLLCDGFFLPGAILICAGLMAFVINEGSFTILSYAIRNFGLFFFTKKTEGRESYADYARQKREKRTPFGFLLITGGAYLLIACVFLLLFYQNM